jgi:hypothetical protein
MFTKEKGREWRARRYAERVSNGLCVSCGSISETGRVRCRKCANAYSRTPEVKNAANRKWRQAKVALGLCSKCGKSPHAHNRKLCVDCLKISLDNTRRALAENPNLGKESKMRLFLECLDAYGGRVCACCGVDILLFLSLDHINNDGSAHRKAMGHKSRKAGSHQWSWLKKHGFPPGMQVLCMNCNFGKMRNGGICPHQQAKAQAAAV